MMLDIGYNSDIEIREITLPLRFPSSCRILYLSDLHFNRFSGSMALALIDAVEQCKPDLVLLGGDYVDTNAGLPHFETLLLFLKARCPIFAVSGNHDRFFGIKKIKAMLQLHGIAWLEKKSKQIKINGITIQIDGNHIPDKHSPADLRILCLHEPVDTPNSYDLVLAGHLHGSQVVLWQNDRGLFPGRWFYKWNLLQKQMGDCLYVVSKGLGDTIPFRFNCRRDVLLIRV